MKHFTSFLVTFAFLLSILSCGGAGSTPGQTGSPGISPAVLTSIEKISVAAESQQIAVNIPEDLENAPPAEPEQEILASVNKGEPKTSPDSTEPGDKTAAADKTETPDQSPTPDEALKVSKELDVTPDLSEGKWYVTPDAELDIKKSVTYSADKDKINAYSKQIEKLQEDLKGGAIDTDTYLEELKSISDKAGKIRDIIGYDVTQSGVHAFHGDQPLLLSIKDNENPGWYDLKVTAKNYDGAIPDWYSHFNITVYDETNGKELGGLFVKATDNTYQRGGMQVYLAKGSTDLKLNWTNEIFKKGVYDANLQIKNILLTYAQRVFHKNKKFRTALQYSSTDGQWFWSEEGAKSFLPDQVIGFNFPDLEPAKYMITVNAKNSGKLPDKYKNFILHIYADGIDGELNIKASDKKFMKGSTTMDLTGGNTEIYLTWINDEYLEGSYDTNILIKSIELKKTGKSKRSAIVASLLKASGQDRMLLIGPMLVLVLLLSALYTWNRKKASC